MVNIDRRFAGNGQTKTIEEEQTPTSGFMDEVGGVRRRRSVGQHQLSSSDSGGRAAIQRHIVRHLLRGLEASSTLISYSRNCPHGAHGRDIAYLTQGADRHNGDASSPLSELRTRMHAGYSTVCRDSWRLEQRHC